MPADFSLHTTATELEARLRAYRPLQFAPDWTQDWIFPHFQGLSLVNLAQSIPHLLGIALPDARPLDAAVWAGDDPAGRVDRVVLFLSDGLGYKLLQQFMTDDAALRGLLGDLTDGRGAVPLTSISPSTTVAALTTLWTGRAPIAHGIVGLGMFLREFSMPVYMLSLSPYTVPVAPGAFVQWGLDPQTFVPVPGLPELLAKAGIPTHLLLEKSLMGTGLSQVLHRGVRKEHRHRHAGMSDFWLRLRDVLAQTRGQRCAVQVYYPPFDTLAHAYGADTPYTRHEVHEQFSQLNTLLGDPVVQDGRTLFLFAADHGHYNASHVINFSTDPRAQPLVDALRTVGTGEPRMAYLTARDGMRQQIIGTLEREYGDELVWVNSDDAVRAGLFGSEPAYAEALHRLGDVIVFPRLGGLVTDRDDGLSSLVSWHGGLADWEMLIPLIWKWL